MNKRTRNLLFIIPLAIAAFYIARPIEAFNLGSRTIMFHLGLDLVGGVQALLEADLPESIELSPEAMQTARSIIENRANGLLGVGEAQVQVAGDRRIVVELPGETNPEKALEVLGETGELEFVELGNLSAEQVYALEGMTIVTDHPTIPEDAPPGVPIFHTVMTGAVLDAVGVERSQLGEYEIVFSLKPDGAEIFGDYTTRNQGRFLAIVLDKVVLSAPRINQPIIGGQGSITGNYTLEEANDMAIKLRYGSLPVPLKVVESRTIGPSLGADSLEKSLFAGFLGLGLVALFMIGYYRLPGVLAVIALFMYVIFTIALFKLVPVTLTLPGIAGFVLSIGVAVDANILIFERMKEELKDLGDLQYAIEQGWERAWPSIRDSNLSTLITCSILFWFGSAFGATIVKGFAVTLAIGVGVSLFTALVVTRTLLQLVVDNIRSPRLNRLFGG